MIFNKGYTVKCDSCGKPLECVSADTPEAARRIARMVGWSTVPIDTCPECESVVEALQKKYDEESGFYGFRNEQG